MPTPIDPKRLPALRAARDEFSDDDRASQKQIADLYGVTPARLSTLIKNRFPDFPAAERREDKTHWYPARAAVDSMIRYMEGTGKARRANASRIAAVMGKASAQASKEVDEAEPPPLTAADIDRMASAAMKIFRLEKEKGRYVPINDVREVAREVYEITRNGIMGMINALDPNGELTPQQRKRLEGKCRASAIQVYEKLEAYLTDDDGRS